MSNDVLIRITADDRATPEINRVRDSLRSIVESGIGSAIGTTLVNAFSAATGAMQSLIGNAFTTAASFERMEMAIGTLVRREMQNLGESLDNVGQKTQDLINWTRELAKSSPFDPAQVTDALRMALAFGFTTDEARRLTQATLDYAAGAGLTTETMQQVTYALGQIKANSRVTGEEIMQLTNAGIAARDILAKALGVSIEELNKLVSAGKVSAETAVDAILKSLETDFGGAAARQANSLSGLLNTLGELKDTALVTTFRPIFESLKPLAELTISWLEAEGIGKLKAFGETLGQTAKQSVAFVTAIIQAKNPVQKIGSVIASINPDAGNIFVRVFDWITANKDAIVAALTGIAVAIGSITVVTSVSAAITALLNPFNLLLAAAGALAVAWQQNWGDIQTKTQAVLPVVTRYVQDAAAFISEKWREAWPIIQNVTQQAIAAITPIVQNLLNWLQTDGVRLLGEVQTAWQNAWPIILETTQNAVIVIQQIVEKGLNWLSTDGVQLLGDLQAAWQTAWPAIQNATQQAIDAIQPIIERFITWLSTDGVQLLNDLQAAWQAAWPVILETTQNAIDAIRPIIENILNWLSTDGVKLLSDLQNAWQTAWPIIQDATQQAINAITPIVENILHWLATDGVRLLNNLQAAWETTWNAIQKVVDFVVAQIQTIIEAFQAAAADDWYTFGSKLRDVVDASFAAILSIFVSLGERLRAIIASIISSIITAFQTTDWVAVGQSISDGIASGIAQTAQNIARAAIEAASNAVEAVKGFLRIESPSKVFEKQIGMQISAGMAQGILRNVGTVESAATAVASRTLAVTTNISIDARNATVSRDDIEASVQRALRVQQEDKRLRRLA